MSTDFLLNALVYIGAAIIFVPFAKKLGLSSVLGYLIAGILIGPFVMGFVGNEGEDLMHAAEFGVVMMLFLIGLELEPKAFWEMRKSITGLGASQMAFTAVIVCPVLLLLGWDWRTAVAVSMAFAMSSTAIVLQTLKEKNLTRSTAGQASFSVLLFQDIAVIPILALLPLLAVQSTAGNDEAHSSLISHFPGWLQALFIFGAVGVVMLAGRYLVVPFLRLISKTGLRELFTATALFLVIGVAALMQLVGLSAALGTFIAGVVLANTEFRHELEGDIEPFKGLLLGLFFVSVGATIDFEVIGENPGLIAGLSALVLAIKFAVLFGIGKFFKMQSDQNLLFSFGLSQVGEFAFVILNFSDQIEIVDSAITAKCMAVVAITMTATPLLLLINEKFIAPRFGVKTEDAEPEYDNIDTRHKVIIAGFGHFGSTIGRLLRANGVEATILDNDADRVSLLRKMGFKVFYGDATRLDLLHSAGATEAKLFIAAVDSPDTNMEIVELIRKHYPNLTVLTRSRNRFDAYELIDMGVKYIYRETLYTAVHLGVDALSMLGMRRYTATRQGQKFIRFDEQALEKLAKTRSDLNQYILSSRQEIEWQEQLLQNDLNQNMENTDISWDGEYLRSVVTRE